MATDNGHESPDAHAPDAAGPRRSHPPAFNVPGVVLALIAVFAAVHAVRTYLLGPVSATEMLVDFSFIPGCYGDYDPLCTVRMAGADLFSPLTYAFLHGGWAHLGANSVWLLAFGTPVARRFGAGRFLLFSAVGAVAGALVFYLLNPELIAPVIGASGVVSALMGGACRFAFGGRTPVRVSTRPDLPMVSITDALANKTVLIFIAVFFATNLLLGTGVGSAFGEGQVAWQAHLGGFAFGFLLFQLFDPLRARRDRAL